MKLFSGAKKWLHDLDSESAGKLITIASDVALVVSDARQGVIRDVSFGSDELAVELADKWVGKPWADTVTQESRPKIEALLRDSAARAHPVGAWSITAPTPASISPFCMRRFRSTKDMS